MGLTRVYQADTRGMIFVWWLFVTTHFIPVIQVFAIALDTTKFSTHVAPNCLDNDADLRLYWSLLSKLSRMERVAWHCEGRAPLNSPELRKLLPQGCQPTVPRTALFGNDKKLLYKINLGGFGNILEGAATALGVAASIGRQLLITGNVSAIGSIRSALPSLSSLWVPDNWSTPVVVDISPQRGHLESSVMKGIAFAHNSSLLGITCTQDLLESRNLPMAECVHQRGIKPPVVLQSIRISI